MIYVLEAYQTPFIKVTLQYNEYRGIFIVAKQGFEEGDLLEYLTYYSWQNATDKFKQMVRKEIEDISHKSIDEIPKVDESDYEETEDLNELAKDLDNYLYNLNDIVQQIQSSYEQAGQDTFEGNIEDLMHTELINSSSPFRVICFPDGSKTDYSKMNGFMPELVIKNSIGLLKEVEKRLGENWNLVYRRYSNACSQAKIFVTIARA